MEMVGRTTEKQVDRRGRKRTPGGNPVRQRNGQSSYRTAPHRTVAHSPASSRAAPRRHCSPLLSARGQPISQRLTLTRCTRRSPQPAQFGHCESVLLRTLGRRASVGADRYYNAPQCLSYGLVGLDWAGSDLAPQTPTHPRRPAGSAVRHWPTASFGTLMPC